MAGGGRHSSCGPVRGHEGRLAAWSDDVWWGDAWKSNWPVGVTRPPKDVKLTLARPVLNPIELHVNSFGKLLLDGVIDDSAGCAIISLQ